MGEGLGQGERWEGGNWEVEGLNLPIASQRKNTHTQKITVPLYTGGQQDGADILRRSKYWAMASFVESINL